MVRQSLKMQQNFNTSELTEQNELFENEFDSPSNENDSDWFEGESNENDSDWFDSDDFNIPESENDF